MTDSPATPRPDPFLMMEDEDGQFMVQLAPGQDLPRIVHAMRLERDRNYAEAAQQAHAVGPDELRHGVAIRGGYGVTCSCAAILEWPEGWARTEEAARRVVLLHQYGIPESALFALLAALAATPAEPDRPEPPRPDPEFLERPCPACGAALAPSDTHWSLMAGPAGGYVCPQGALR